MSLFARFHCLGQNPQCFVLISIPFLKIRPQEIALCISPSHEPPRSHQVVRVPFRFPPRAPPGHSVRNHPPTATPSTLQRHARSLNGRIAWPNTVVEMQGKGSGERAYCTMLRGGTPWDQDFDPSKNRPSSFVQPECRWWRTSQIRLLVFPIEARRAWKLGNELFLYI